MKITFVRKRHEYDDVYTFSFEAPGLSYDAGQYTHLHIRQGRELMGAVREMSFASAPHESEIFFTMHMASGSKFKSRMAALRPGEKIGLFRSGSHICLPAIPGKELVFIGGGVGMTPFRSMICSAQGSGHKISVIQVQRGNFLYEDELRGWVSNYLPIRPDSFDEQVSEVALSASDTAQFYVCGSARLVKGVRTILRDSAIADARIHIENYN